MKIIFAVISIYLIFTQISAQEHENVKSRTKSVKEDLGSAIPMHGNGTPSRGGLLKLPSKGSLKLPMPLLKQQVNTDSNLSETVSVDKLRFDGASVNGWSSSDRHASFKVWSSHQSIRPGQDFAIVIRVGLQEGWHIYGAGETIGKITRLSLISGELQEVEQGLSPSISKVIQLGDQALVSQYLVDGSFAWIKLRLRDDLIMGASLRLKLKLSYQICSSSVCLLPSEDVVSIGLNVGRSETNQIPPDFTEAQSLFNLKNEVGAGEGSRESLETSYEIENVIQDNLVLALLMAFLWGLLASLTPCVYPMIPITVSLFAAGGEDQSRLSRLISASFYVIGIALVYALLGVVTSRTGRDLGSWLAEPVVVFPLAMIMLLLAFSMFGLFEMDLPHSLKSRLSSIEGRSPLTLLMMGGAMGFVAAPCVGPFAGSIILWLAKNPGSPGFGFLLMACFGLGMGSLFMIIAVFSQEFLPKSGIWMIKLKQVMGYLLIGMAYYFVSVMLSDEYVRLGWVLYIMLAGGLMGAFAQLSWDDPWWKHLAKTVGITLFILGLFQIWSVKFRELPKSSIEHSNARLIHDDFDVAHAAAIKTGRPLFLYFGARWCIPCKKIKEVVLKDHNVRDALERFEIAYLDCTSADSKSAKLKESLFKTPAMPFFAFFDSSGSHLRNLDVHGSIDASGLIEQLKKVK